MAQEWIKVEGAAKNDATGEYHALVGGKWVPASGAAKNDTTGEYHALMDAQAVKPARTVTESIVDTGIDAVRGVVGAGESLIGIADMATGNLAGRGLSAIGYDPKETHKILASGYSERRKEADQAVRDAKGFSGTVGALIDNPSAAFGTIVQSAPMSLTGAAAVRMAATKMLAGAGIEAGTVAAANFLKSPEVAKKLLIVGGASEGAMTSGSIEEQSRQAGRDYTDSVLPALAGGVITGAIGYGSSKIPGFKDAEVAAATAGMGAKNSAGLIAAGKEIAKSAIKEGVLEELPQSAQEQVFTNLALGKPWSEGVGEAAAQGMVAGMGTGVGMTAYSEAANRMGKPPVPLTEMAAKESARQRTAVTGEEHAIIDAPDGKKAVVPASVLKDIQQPVPEVQQAAPEAAQPVEPPNASPTTDDILGGGQGAPAQAVSAEDAAMLQGAQEQGIAPPVDPVIEQQAASFNAEVAAPAAGPVDHFANGVTPEALGTFFADEKARHVVSITLSEGINGAFIQPADTGLAVDPAIAASPDPIGSQPDSLRGNEGGFDAEGDRLAGQPAPGTEQPDAAQPGSDNAVAARIDAAAHEAATSPLNDLPEPTQAMKEAGNYKKAHVSIQGIDVAIENPKGSVRSGTDDNGSWSVAMPDHYGYIKRTEGADGDALDTFIGKNPESNKVFVVDQVNPDTGKFEQHKAMIGFDNAQDAMSSYQSAFTDKGKERMGAVAEMNVDQFKNWLAEGDTKKPLAPQIQNMPAQKKASAASENMITRIKQLGGINLSHIRDVTGESNTKNVRAVGLFSKTGKGLDDLAVMLHDDGFDVGMHDDTDNGGVNRLSDQIRSALDGNAVLTVAATERKAAADVEAEHNHNIKEQAKALGIKTVARKMAAIEADVIAHQKAADQAKFDALQSELQKYGLVLDAIISEAQSLIGEQGVSSALRHAGEFIENNDITDESAQIRAMIESVKSEVKLRKNHDEIQDPNARQVAEGLAGQSDRAGGIQDRPEGNREGQSGSGFELTGQTAEEVAASERAQAAQDAAAREDEASAKSEQAKKDQDAVDAKVKARTDNADNFQFGESSKDAAAPEGDLFNQPAAESNQSNDSAEIKSVVDKADALGLKGRDRQSFVAEELAVKWGMTRDEVADDEAVIAELKKPPRKASRTKANERAVESVIHQAYDAAAESKPTDKITLMAVSNKPFPTEKSAQSSIKQRKLNATAVPVEGGFGIKHAQEHFAQVESSSEQAAKEKADTDFDDALADLGDILGKNFRASFTPEQEQKIIPVLTRLFDAAFRKGYYKFKDAARFVLDSISARLGKEVADEITIDHLAGAYTGMAGRYKDQGADSRRAVAEVESKDELGERNVTDKRSGTSLERDSADTNTSDGVGAQGVRDGRNGDGGTGGQGVLDSESEGGSRRSDGVPGRDAAADGERGNLEIYTGASPDEASIARDRVDQRSDSTGVDGPPIESDATSVAEELAESGVSLEEARAEQRKADAQEHKPGIENIRKTLPILTEAQQDDVHIAETRFAKPDGYGMLFTNGTGTGKTFTGLGIIKRFVTSGKSNIIITAPNDKIADDWKKAGRLLGLDITRLPDTKSAGSGVVIATYANFGQNNELAKRNWDLIVHDEAHYLAMDKNGTNTLSLHNLRAISMSPAGASTRATMLHADLIDNLAKVHADIKAARESGDDRHLAKLPALEAKEKTLVEKWRAANEAVKADVESKQGVSRPRVLFLSATPFAYEKTVDWANGYLFDYNEGRGKEGSESRGYNAGSNSDQFMMQHFGYRMRYGKLTAPDAKVDSGLMQRQFNTMLKKSGVLSGRMLDVKADYDRRFVLVDSAIGSRIDAALQWFEDQRTGGKDEKQSDADKSRSEALRDLRDVLGEKFDYLSRRYLLEAIKAQEVIPHVKEHMALGRKVVVFHDYKKGGGFNPFNVSSMQAGGDVDPARASAFNAAVREFRTEFKDLIDSDVWRASSPITAFQQTFSGTTHPKVLLFNGDVSAKDRRAAVEKFQDDASGPQVILVQSAAGKEGISLHDTTGKHQRVLFNLGQPTQPTTAIQQEGRIYRTGQATDAIFRYLNTGTNWEKWAFATTIAQRASAAENLGMGEQARALKDAFITGFEESDDYRAGMEDEGKGGKERDRAANNALTEYDRARAFYFGTQKKNSRTKAQEGTDYFATPEPVGLKMVELADIRPGESAIEPSAGHGAIARWMPTTAERTAIEPSTALRPRLAMVFDGKIIGSDFEDMHVSNKFDAIVMNPPFGVGGKTAIEHLAKAATHLRDGGRIVALIPQGGMADKRFDKWMYSDEEQRPVKPIHTDAKHGPIYEGDTLTMSAFGTEVVIENVVIDGAGSGPFYARHKGESKSTGVNLIALKSVTPIGARTESYSPSKGFHLVANIKLPSVTFERAGTAVNTRIVVIEKSDKAPQFTQRDYSGETDINELFNRMESLSISPRAKAAEDTQAAQESVPQKPEKPAKAQVGDVVAIDKTEYPIEIYTTNDGKDKRGVWMDEAPAKKLNPRAFKTAKNNGTPNQGKFFVDEYWLAKAGIKAAAQNASNDPSLLSLGSKSTSLGWVSLGVVDGVISRVVSAKKSWNLDIVSVPSFDALPDEVKQGISKYNNSENDHVKGVTHNGKVYVIADANESESDVEMTILHEAEGHVGIHRLYGSKITEKLNYLFVAIGGEKGLSKLANDRGIAADMVEYSKMLGGSSFDNSIRTRIMMDEMLAHYAENPKFGDRVKAIVGMIRAWLRSHGFAKLSEYGDTDLLHVLRQGRQQLSKSGTAASNTVALMKSGKNPLGLNTPAQPGSSIPEETKFEKRQRQVQDKMNRFAVLQKWLKFKGVSLTEKADVHANENLMHAKIANQTQDFRDHVETPLIERAAQAGFTLADIADYLEAQHIPEANARMRDIHHDANATANGITDAEANQALAEFQAMPKFSEFKKIADEFRAIGDETLNLRLREGLISRDQYDAYKGTYQHWVPLRGNGKKPGVGKGLSVNAKEKRRLGHGQREDGEMVIENLLMDRERAIYQVEHNRVGKSIIQFALEAKEPDMITVGKPEKRQVLKDKQVFEVQYKGRMMKSFSSESDAKSFINQAIALSSSRQGGGMARSNFAIAKSNDPIVIMQASPMLAENEIQVYVAGHTIRVQLNDELLARAATNMGVDQVNSLLAAGRIINNGLSKIYTAYSPDFIFRNAIRDFIAGTINLTGDMGVKMAGKIYANYGKAAKELFVARNDPRKSAWVQRYRAAGGNTGAAYLSDIERIGADAQAAMHEHMKGMEVYRTVHDQLISEGRNQVYAHTAAAMKTGVAKFSSIPVLGHFLTLIEHLNAVTENALRLATYMTLVQNGYSEQQAAVAAKNSTVNFNRKGEISNVMGAAYLFFNPSVQGSTRMFSSLLKSEHKGQAQAMAGMLAFAAFALAELGRGGDDDDERKWKNIPDHVKDHNLIFKFGDLQYTIPVPYEFAPFHALGNSISNAVHGESGWKASMKVLKSLVDNLSPLGDPFAGESKDGANLFQVTPTVVKMALASHENQNSFAAPIQPEKNSFSKNKPDSQNMFRNTEGSLYAGAAEWVNEITGGSDYKAGGIDVSPEVLKFWVSTLTGGTGRFVFDMGDAAFGAYHGVAPDLRSTPIARVFVREASVADARSRFWEAANEAKVAADELAMAKKDHNGSAAKEIRDAEGDMIKLSRMAGRMGKAASKKRDAIDAIRQDDQMPLEQKREQMKEIEQKEGEYYDRFLKMFDKAAQARRDKAA